MAFKMSLLADASSAIREMNRLGLEVEDLVKVLDDVATSTDSMADDIEGDAKRAGRALETKIADGLKEVRREAHDTGTAIGRDVKAGTDKAGDGVTEFKDEAKSTAREAAASFSDVEGALDGVQEIAANALAGFGPAGQAAGIGLAVGFGLAMSAAQDYAEKVNEAKEKTIEAGEALADIDFGPGALVNAEKLRDIMATIVDKRQWWELWQDAPVTMLEQLADAADRYGLSFADMTAAVTGDAGALEASLAAVNARIADQEAQSTYTSGLAGITEAAGPVDAALLSLRTRLEDTSAQLADQATYAELLKEAQGSLSDTLADAATVQADYEASVVDTLTTAGEAWEDYVEDGKLNIDAYVDNIEAQMAAVAAFESNLVAASSMMSAEALAYVQQLGPAAAPLLQEFINAPTAQRDRLNAVWTTLGSAATDGYEQGLAVTDATKTAIEEANTAAQARPIRVPMKPDDANLNNDVQRAIDRLPTYRINARVGIERVT